MCNCNNAKKYGVVLVTRCLPKSPQEEATYLMLRELRSKPEFFKNENMLAFPSETKEVTDACVCATVKRLGHEELGRVFHSEDIMILPEPLTHFRHGLPVYVAWTEVQEEFVPHPNDTDVEYCGWFTESAIRDMSRFAGLLRIETIDVFESGNAAVTRAPSFV